MITDADRAELVEAFRKIQKDAATERKHVCWRKRLIFVAALAGVFSVAGYMLHEEFLFKGWEFLVAATVDKLIFGMA